MSNQASSRFKFNSLKDGLPDSKPVLRQLAFYAYWQFVKDGGKITVCRPGVARGAEFSRNQHPKLGVKAPLT